MAKVGLVDIEIHRHEHNIQNDYYVTQKNYLKLASPHFLRGTSIFGSSHLPLLLFSCRNQMNKAPT